MCAMLWCDLDLTSDLAVVALTFQILSWLYLGNCKVYKVDAWKAHWLGVRCTLWCDLDLSFDLAIVTLTCKMLSVLYLRNYKV